jgi:hypothetical protein
LVLGPAAVIVGFVSLEHVKQSKGLLQGSGLAVAGIVVGIAGILASVAWLIHINSGSGGTFCVGSGGNVC